jgi:hypothetical protein
VGGINCLEDEGERQNGNSRSKGEIKGENSMNSNRIAPFIAKSKRLNLKSSDKNNPTECGSKIYTTPYIHTKEYSQRPSVATSTRPFYPFFGQHQPEWPARK